MISTNEDWETLCAIYDDGDGEDDTDEDVGENMPLHNDRRVRLVVSSTPKGFCGTIYMTLSTSKIAFARLVRTDGSYRYFTIAKPPVLKLDFLYVTSEARKSNNEFEDSSGPEDDNAPSTLEISWERYPPEWPFFEKEKYRSALAEKCKYILNSEGSFSVCQFLEHEAISFYYQKNDSNASMCSDESKSDDPNKNEAVSNASNSWKTYFDENLPGYLLVILPPEIEQLYYPQKGILLHPRKEAARLEEQAEKDAAITKKISNKKTSTEKRMKKKSNTLPSNVTINTTLDFGRHALLQNWKDLYRTRCPICLEESILYSDGVVLPYCRHYCCRDCFEMYLKFKVQDLKQHRTNPFVCPLESCKRELPMLFCKPFLSPEDIATAKAWYKDLKNPPAWSLDRCLCTKTCGAIASMRRKKSVVSIDESGKTVIITKPGTKSVQGPARLLSPSPSSNDLQFLVFCDNCKKTWCELCLTRVYDDGKNKKHTVSTHKSLCNPKPILRFCRKYMEASEEVQHQCRAKYPWIVSYSQFCEHDGAALQYVLDHGQRCPNCQTGVERTEGCFHMKCPTCATHFCYECGTELFPPYYGTHHCWEEGYNDDDGNDDGQEHPAGFDYEVDEQLAMALQWGGW